LPILKAEPDLHPEDLFTRPDDGSPWWVAYVRSRQEKALARHLREQGVRHYLPQSEKRVRRAGRSFVSHLPLFPGYLFFRGAAADRLSAVRSNLIVHILDVEDGPTLASELRELWRLQQQGLPLVPHAWVGPGDEVRITDGPLRGWTGTVLREKGSLRLIVSVSFLRQSVAAELDRDSIAPLAPERWRQERWEKPHPLDRAANG
jgi:transcription antitermination factor NusG